MMMLLNVESNCVQFVGICGMGGIGKTTIATVLYNQISSSFEGYSFLADVAEKSSERNGLVHLQNELLDEILRIGYKKFYNVSQGKMVIKKSLHAKKVLLILDNVNNKQQLDALTGSNWFGPGSKIIVTTRDKQVLEIFPIGNVYRLEELDADESLQLFSKHAFGRDRPPKGCMELSKNVINIAGGLPLALEVLGRTLSIEPPKDWESMVKKWEKFPPKEVEETLKISYDCLDDEVKRMFLDIACFFIGMDEKIVIDIWDSCGFSSGPGLKVLVRKFLVKIDDNNELRMHDQLRDMGRNIVCQKNMEPRKRSRLWIHEEVLDVLKNPMGTLNVEALLLKYENKGSSSEVNLNTKAFALMPKLRLLQLDSEHFEGCLEHLPQKLNWLCWKRCPFESIPTDFHLEKLAVLDLSQSKIKKLWCPNKPFENLKVLNLSYCSCLTRSPEFSGLLCLERLILEGCVELIEIDETIEYLHKLVLLNLRCCSKLNKLPENLFGLESLEVLLLDCTSIEQLPTSIGDLNNLARLSLCGCRLLGRIPDSVWRINSLIFLTLGAILINEILDTDISLNKLQKLHIESCGFFNRVPDWIGNVRNLRSLCINGCNITELPDVIGSLEKLERLDVSNCKQLVKLPSSMGKLRLLSHFNMEETGIVKLPNDFGLLSSLVELEMAFCREFEGFPESFGSLAKLRILHAQYCSKLRVLPTSFSGLCSLKELNARACNIVEVAIPEDFGELSKLETLELSRNPFATLPDSISGLSQLKRLHLEGCWNLNSIAELPSSLIELNANGCQSIEILPNLSNLTNLQDLHLSQCEHLNTMDGLEGLESLRGLYMSGCNSINDMSFLQGVFKHLSYFTFPGSEIPWWFTHEMQTCEVSRHLAGEITGVILCIVLRLTKELPEEWYLFEESKNSTIYIDIVVWRNGRVISRSQTSMDGFTSPDEDQIYLCHFRDENEDFVSALKGGDKIEVSKIFIPEFRVLQVKKCGIHMVYKPKEGLESHNQNTQPSIYQKLAYFFTSLKMESFFPEWKSNDLNNSTNEIFETDILLNKLEELHIVRGRFFNRVPDWIGNVRNLTSLCIDGSIITELPDVVGSLEKLEKLDVSNCKKLVKLPSSMGKLRLLSHFNMEGTGIVKLPNDFGLLSSLEELEMAFCREFEGFRKSFGSLAKLRILHAQYCSKLSVLPRTFLRLSSLKELNASYCNLLEGAIPKDFGKLSKLETLKLSGNHFATLPNSISGLSRLKRLHLESCENLISIPELPSSLIEINANQCRSMRRLPNLSNLSNLQELQLSDCGTLISIPELPSSLIEINANNCGSMRILPNLSNLSNLQELHLSNCRTLIAIDGLEGLESLRGLYMSGCGPIIKRNLLQGVFEHLSYFTFPGVEIPQWFTCQTQTCEVSRNLAGEITGVILCIVLSLTEWLRGWRYPFDASNNTIYIDISVWRNGRVISRSQTSMDAFMYPHEDQIYLCHFRDENEDFVSALKGGDKIKVSKIFIPKGLQMKKCGIHIVYKPNEGVESPNQNTQPSIYQKLAHFFIHDDL